MKTAIAIIQNIILRKLEQDPQFSEEKADAIFWEKLATNLLHFEEDAKPVYARIYSLELAAAEKVIDKLPGIYAQFLKELAESHVLGESSEATQYLTEKNNVTFLKEVRFLKTMQQAIKSVERKQLKKDLPKSYERLTFELSEADFANVAKKQGRNDLKNKFKKWDKELVEEEAIPVVSMLTDEAKKPAKVIALSWIKYAAAACVIIAAGIFYFKNTDPDVVPIENTVVTKEKIQDKVQPQINPPTVEAIVLAPIEVTSITTTVLQPESLGFASDKKEKITIKFNDVSQRIVTLEKFIETNKEVESKILDQHKAELTALKTQKGKYLFDGQTLTLFSGETTTAYEVIQTEEQGYYLKKGNNYYTLKVNIIPSVLQKVVNATTIETLEKIHFENQ